MKITAIFTACLFTLLLISCKDDDNPVVDYEYHAHIHQPSSADKQIGDVMFIEIEFESHTGENVEHINVRIFNKNTNIIVYDKPSDPHIAHNGDNYLYEDQITLSAANGFSEDDWVLEAKVWGAEHEQDLVTESVEFHIHN
jgi:hypothetical protein